MSTEFAATKTRGGLRPFHAHEIPRVDELNCLPLASFRKRAFAILIDSLIVLMLRAPFGFLHHRSSGHEATTMATLVLEGMHEVERLVESFVYFALALKWAEGQTIGKWMMGIRVLSLTHHKIGWWQAIERALGYGASLLEGGFGFFQYYLNRNRQTVHDRIAETIVVDIRAPRFGNPNSAEPC
jgi:hypothetical protein